MSLMILILPVGSIFAYNDGVNPIGILHMQPSTTSYNGVSEKRFTDNNLTLGGPQLRYEDAWYEWELSEPFDINKVFLKAQESQRMARIMTYDENHNYIGDLEPVPLDSWMSVNLTKGVKYVRLTTQPGKIVTVSEFDVAGVSSASNVNTDKSKFVINNLVTKSNDSGSVNLTWDRINSLYFKKFKVFMDDVLLAEVTSPSYSVSGLEEGKTYTFKVVPVDNFDEEFTGSTITYKVPLPDTTPPGQPYEVVVTPDRYSALVKWKKPLTEYEDIQGYFVYLDGNRVNSQPITTESYNLTGLNLDTEYKVSVLAVDYSANASDESDPVTFKTLDLETVPSAPTNVSATPYNGSASVSWLPSSTAKNYKLYVDGNYKLTTNQTSVKLTGLENGLTYSITVSAVNDIGESAQSTAVTVTPSKDLLPDVSLGYSLKDVSDGVSSWFSSYWLLLAFTIAIPLSFYVGNRVKGLFS